MAVLELTKEQIVQLVRQLPAPEKREVLLLLAQASATDRARRQQDAEQRLRQLCAARGLSWDAMTAAAREAFIDDLVHEDRRCAP